MTRDVGGGGRGALRKGVEDHHGPDVHVGAVVRLLKFEERGVKRSETFRRRHAKDHPTIARRGPALSALKLVKAAARGGTFG
jgi:hypothetical protein